MEAVRLRFSGEMERGGNRREGDIKRKKEGGRKEEERLGEGEGEMVREKGRERTNKARSLVANTVGMNQRGQRRN